MYKNAELAINSGTKSKSAIRRTKHLMELGRIEHKIKSMQLTKSTDESVGDYLSFSTFNDNDSIAEQLRREERESINRMYKSSLLVPPHAIRKPLDEDLIGSFAKAYRDGLENVLKLNFSKVETQMQQKMKRRKKATQNEKAALEKKLQTAILFVYAAPTAKTQAKRRPLKNAEIAPYYIPAEIDEFVVRISEVDKDYDGTTAYIYLDMVV
jgi:hypothetical protein